MRTIKGPAIFLAQFVGDRAPFNALDSMAAWAANLGYKGVQIPTWDSRLFDLEKAAKSKTYCDDLKGTLAKHAIVPTELSTHLQGQLVAVHPAYDLAFDSFAPQGLRRKPRSRQEWAASQLKLAAAASANLGLAHMRPSPAPLLGRIFIHGRSDQLDWWKRRSMNWPIDGGQFRCIR